MYLSFLKIVNEIGSYAWGSALLANINYCLVKYKRNPTDHGVKAMLYFVQFFAFERFKWLRENTYRQPLNSSLVFPLLSSWTGVMRDVSHNTRMGLTNEHFSQFFHNLREDQITWRPYNRLDALLPPNREELKLTGVDTLVLCMNKIAWHRPSFSLQQVWCPTVPLEPYPLNIKPRSGMGLDWSLEYDGYVREWDQRNQRFMELSNASQAVARGLEAGGAADNVGVGDDLRREACGIKAGDAASYVGVGDDSTSESRGMETEGALGNVGVGDSTSEANVDHQNSLSDSDDPTFSRLSINESFEPGSINRSQCNNFVEDDVNSEEGGWTRRNVEDTGSVETAHHVEVVATDDNGGEGTRRNVEDTPQHVEAVVADNDGGRRCRMSRAVAVPGCLAGFYLGSTTGRIIDENMKRRRLV
ncbi:serine/threonine-protein phosphatase 7 long form-like protein [Senna tora]|uniref:Serine/threonine-protein phosphatase 7 long form-like protein n=1 Tax=Senna tora TaxID=362788 RepID=A0A834TYW9_9FABA|nr:serine/threonine-protein phosphatase 7 long form-like protein [Senna tora]